MIKERVTEIFVDLFTLCSIKLIQLVESEYEHLDAIEKYFKEEKEDIEKSAKDTARSFAEDLFIGALDD